MITISDKEHNFERELEERIRRFINAVRRFFTWELKKKEMKSRKKAGLILSGIGNVIYLLTGFSYVFFVIGGGNLRLPLLFIGIFSLTGILIGVNDIKEGGAVILISIPLSVVYIFILNIISPYYRVYDMFYIAFHPIPYPHSLFLIIGGILCLMSSD